MSALGCCLWWLLLGVLIGLLLSWLLGKLIGKGPSVPERVDGIDHAAARAAGYYIAGPESLEIIEGIGPELARILRDNGVRSLHTLGASSVATLQGILAKGGERLRVVNPQTWPEQARLATSNRWVELRELQNRLFNGVRV